MWRSRTRKCFCTLWRFLSHPSRKTSHFGPTGTNKIWIGRNVTIRLEAGTETCFSSDVFLFPSPICHLSRKRKAGRPIGLRPTLIQLASGRKPVTKHHHTTIRSREKNPNNKSSSSMATNKRRVAYFYDGGNHKSLNDDEITSIYHTSHTHCISHIPFHNSHFVLVLSFCQSCKHLNGQHQNNLAAAI